jgi:AraC-like DNA-binding protein
MNTTVSDYREFLPPVQLKPHLICLWTQTITDSTHEFNSKDTFAQHVLPDGCVDVVAIDDEAPAVVGPWTQPFVARFSPGTVITGARFRPGAAATVLGLPASHLLNQSVELRALWRAAATERFERVAGAGNVADRLSALEGALLNRMEAGISCDSQMHAAVRWLARHPQNRIEQLSDHLGLSCRQLQRRFVGAVGYGPKKFQSVLRFQRLLNLAALKNGPRSLAQFSADCGYADQAHMAREVRRLSGLAPSALLRSTQSALQLSDLLAPLDDN